MRERGLSCIWGKGGLGVGLYGKVKFGKFDNVKKSWGVVRLKRANLKCMEENEAKALRRAAVSDRSRCWG